ncbi:MAG: hypothetical protein QHC67_13055 [Sphingobium sp.]|uniref:hypothetical protein n=1 Tax=Sphingobium sp. TaxID=1912891 RepID=UPI0029BC7BFB|nr:hypothetical protein [Sphingobium sp.]MDX3910728.1 hypothetical protein [Sphingobium sp.]
MHLLRRIEVFIREHDIPPTRFGRESVRDPRLVLDMRNGREPGQRMKSRVEHFMNKYKEGAKP